MKRQIRSSVFETNSSSTHSIAIPKNCNIANRMRFYVGEFGWAFEEVDAADYFYTAIHATSENMAEFKKKMERFKQILKNHDIEATFEDAHCNERHGWLSHDGYIDHGFELSGFVNELLNDEDKLLRFLSGGLVFTGNDNQDSMGFTERNREFIYDWDYMHNIRNEYYMSNHEEYEWYDK